MIPEKSKSEKIEPEKPQAALYGDTAFVDAQIRLAEAELAQFQQHATSEIKFRQGVIYALRQVAKREAVLQTEPTALPNPDPTK